VLGINSAMTICLVHGVGTWIRGIRDRLADSSHRKCCENESGKTHGDVGLWWLLLSGERDFGLRWDMTGNSGSSEAYDAAL